MNVLLYIPVKKDLDLLKVSFSSAEWCGHVYSEAVVDGDRIVIETNSYFEGESGTQTVDRPERGVTGEELFILLRGLKGPFLEPGAQITMPFLPSAFRQRLAHLPAQWTEATLRRGSESKKTAVPAGEFEVIVYDVEIADGREGRFEIEAAWPHRIVRWSLAPDVEGVLRGSLRSAYWEQNREGDEARLRELGLEQSP